MDAAPELGRNPVSKHQIQPEYGDEQADARRVLLSPSRPASACSFSILRMNLVLTYGIPPEFRGGVHLL